MLGKLSWKEIDLSALLYEDFKDKNGIFSPIVMKLTSDNIIDIYQWKTGSVYKYTKSFSFIDGTYSVKDDLKRTWSRSAHSENLADNNRWDSSKALNMYKTLADIAVHQEAQKQLQIANAKIIQEAYLLALQHTHEEIDAKKSVWNRKIPVQQHIQNKPQESDRKKQQIQDEWKALSDNHPPTLPAITSEACRFDIDVAIRYNTITWKKKDDIKKIQEVLQQTLKSDIKIDGYWGKNTTLAVAIFQEKYDIDNDGRVWPATIAKINELGKQTDSQWQNLHWVEPPKRKTPRKPGEC